MLTKFCGPCTTFYGNSFSIAMKLSSRIGVSMFMAPCQTTPVHRMARLFGQSLSSPNTPLISLACSYHAELLSRQSCVMWLHTHKVKWATCGHRESGNSSCSMDCGWIFCSPISQAMSYNKRNNAINANIRTQPKRPFTHFRTSKTFLDTDVVSLRYSLLRVGNV